MAEGNSITGNHDLTPQPIELLLKGRTTAGEAKSESQWNSMNLPPPRQFIEVLIVFPVSTLLDVIFGQLTRPRLASMT